MNDKNEKECYVCNGTGAGFSAPRCEKHDVCLTCGVNRKDLTEIPWHSEGGFVCRDCARRKIKDKIEAFQAENAEEEEFYGDDIICPYCGQKHESDYEVSAFYCDGDHEFTCGDCGNEFKVRTCISFSYTSTRMPPPEDNS